MERTSSRQSRIVLGVSAGIAAYKAASLLRLLVKDGHDVTVIPTPATENFVGLATWEALSGNPVTTTVFDGVPEVRHVRLGSEADLVVVAPATASFLAKAARGDAENLLLATLLVASCPVVLAPAMHTQMWEHPATRANVALLRNRGVIVIEPASGQLTGSDSGVGRLPEPGELYNTIREILEAARSKSDLSGVRVLISTGGTQEPIDPVRFIGNRSSGKQGLALAASAAARGALVTVVAANVTGPVPASVDIVEVSTAREMRDEVLGRASESDIVVMAAAVADYRPERAADAKIKKEALDTLDLKLIRNPDILLELVANRRSGQVIVGFAAETSQEGRNVLELGLEKAIRKGADYLIINDVSGGQVFGQDENTVIMVNKDGEVQSEVSGSKAAVSDAIWDVIAFQRA